MTNANSGSGSEAHIQAEMWFDDGLAVFDLAGTLTPSARLAIYTQLVSKLAARPVTTVVVNKGNAKISSEHGSEHEAWSNEAIASELAGTGVDAIVIQTEPGDKVSAALVAAINRQGLSAILA